MLREAGWLWGQFSALLAPLTTPWGEAAGPPAGVTLNGEGEVLGVFNPAIAQ